jgi:hypothetical protein
MVARKPTKPCEHCGNPRPHHARRFCSQACHGAACTTQPAERFWAKVQKTDACWIWTGSKNEFGYGTFTRRSGESPRRAHRFAWELVRSAIPKGLSVLHNCDNPACVNPDHLFLGTHRDNMHDMVQKGRARVGGPSQQPNTEQRARGQQHGCAKLADTDVRVIRSERAAGVRVTALMQRFNVSRNTIQRIVHRRLWTHLE